MSDITVTIGGVALRDFEVPEAIAFAGEQRLAVNSVIGGGQVVNALGYGPDLIVLRGIFSGEDAGVRAQLIDGVRASGLSVPLIWDAFFYNVVITRFLFDYTKPWWIPFEMRCAVVLDPAEAAAALLAPIATLVADDVAAGLGYVLQAGLSGLFVDAASGPSLTSAQGAAATAVQTSGVSLLQNASGLNGAADASSGVAALSNVQQSAGALAGASAAGGYFSRAASNFAGGLL